MINKIVRWVLGIFLLSMGINKFFPYMPPMELSESAEQFIGALAATGYMLPMVGVVEIATGAMLLSAATAPLAIVLLAPLSVNVILFHAFLDPASGLFAAFVFLANAAFGIYYFDFYRPIFARVLSERVVIEDKKTKRRASQIRVATVN